MKRFIATLITTLLVAGVVIYFSQGPLIFPAPDVDVSDSQDGDFERAAIPTADGEVLFALHHPSENDEATIIVFHGNADAAIYQKTKGRELINAGFGVLLAEYRGYPGSTGTPSESGLYEDGRAAYDFLIEQRQQPIGIYAHSLGTGVAVNLATEREVFALVLESPFDSMQAVVQRHYPWLPVGLLLKHKFRSDLKIENAVSPVLIIHGDADQVIPIEHAKRLRSLAGSDAVFLEVENAGHNNLLNFQTTGPAIYFLHQALNDTQ